MSDSTRKSLTESPAQDYVKPDSSVDVINDSSLDTSHMLDNEASNDIMKSSQLTDFMLRPLPDLDSPSNYHRGKFQNLLLMNEINVTDECLRLESPSSPNATSSCCSCCQSAGKPSGPLDEDGQCLEVSGNAFDADEFGGNLSSSDSFEAESESIEKVEWGTMRRTDLEQLNDEDGVYTKTACDVSHAADDEAMGISSGNDSTSFGYCFKADEVSEHENSEKNCNFLTEGNNRLDQLTMPNSDIQPTSTSSNTPQLITNASLLVSLDGSAAAIGQLSVVASDLSQIADLSVFRPTSSEKVEYIEADCSVSEVFNEVSLDGPSAQSYGQDNYASIPRPSQGPKPKSCCGNSDDIVTAIDDTPVSLERTCRRKKSKHGSQDPDAASVCKDPQDSLHSCLLQCNTTSVIPSKNSMTGSITRSLSGSCSNEHYSSNTATNVIDNDDNEFIPPPLPTRNYAPFSDTNLKNDSHDTQCHHYTDDKEIDVVSHSGGFSDESDKIDNKDIQQDLLTLAFPWRVGRGSGSRCWKAVDAAKLDPANAAGDASVSSEASGKALAEVCGKSTGANEVFEQGSRRLSSADLNSAEVVSNLSEADFNVACSGGVVLDDSALSRDAANPTVSVSSLHSTSKSSTLNLKTSRLSALFSGDKKSLTLRSKSLKSSSFHSSEQCQGQPTTVDSLGEETNAGVNAEKKKVIKKRSSLREFFGRRLKAKPDAAKSDSVNKSDWTVEHADQVLEVEQGRDVAQVQSSNHIPRPETDPSETDGRVILRRKPEAQTQNPCHDIVPKKRPTSFFKKFSDSFTKRFAEPSVKQLSSMPCTELKSDDITVCQNNSDLCNGGVRDMGSLKSNSSASNTPSRARSRPSIPPVPITAVTSVDAMVQTESKLGGDSSVSRNLLRPRSGSKSDANAGRRAKSAFELTGSENGTGTDFVKERSVVVKSSITAKSRYGGVNGRSDGASVGLMGDLGAGSLKLGSISRERAGTNRESSGTSREGAGASREGAEASRERAGASQGMDVAQSVLSSQTEFIQSLCQLKQYGWYWGPLGWEEAESKLADQSDGSFLVRDSSNEHYILSLSFKSQGTIHHTRIEHYKGMFSFHSQPKSHGAATIVEFIERAMEHSRNGKYLYFLRPQGAGHPPAPVQLLYPVSRFARMQSLQHACRFEILQHVRRDHVELLPLPSRVIEYLLQAQYYTEFVSDG